MHLRITLPLVALILSCSLNAARAQDPSAEQPSSGLQGVLGVSAMAQAAVDLRKSGEAFERFSVTLNGVAQSVSQSLAAMSSEFDPFGYKTAFRTLRRQTEMLQQQRDIIRDLQQKELEQLRRAHTRLKKKNRKLRKKQRSK